MLVDFDDLRLLISQWQLRPEAPQLARTLGMAMTRLHLQAGHDVVAAQFAVRESFFEAIDSIVEATSAGLLEFFLVADPDCVARRFHHRRAARTAEGEADVAADIPTGEVDEVVRWAADELAKVASTRPHALAVDAGSDLDSTYAHLRGLLGTTG